MGEFNGKIEVLNTHVCCVGNSQLSVGKLQLLALTFFAHNATVAVQLLKFGAASLQRKYCVEDSDFVLDCLLLSLLCCHLYLIFHLL